MAMVFAVHEINRNSNLLPNVTLGYSLYDNCGALIIGFRAALVLASSQEEQFLLQQNCSGNPPVVGIVGDSYSTFSIASSNVLGLFRFPMSDLVQSGGGCLSYSEVLPWGNDASELRRIVDVMKKSTARVVMVFAHEIHIYQLMKEVVRQNVTGLQWMASEAWTLVDMLQTSSFMPYLAGTLGIAIRKGEMFGFRDFLLRIHPEQVDNKYGNSIINQFWEHMFQCRFAHQGWLGADGPLCTGQEDLKNVKSELFDVSNLRPEYNVYKAVYALAHALHDMLQCEPGRGPFTGHSCGSLKGLEPWQLVYYLDNINFTTTFGDQVTFDENGDALPIYDIMNWHWLPDGTTYIQNVGGLFEVHYTSVFPEQTFTSEPNRLSCRGFDPPGFRHAMTMAFAIDEINKNSNLLPNVTLGYSLYDNCATLVVGFSAALSLASGHEEQFLLQPSCFGSPPVLGIVGDSFSTFSIATSDVIGLFKLPIVSYFATCSCLSDRQRFPSFFRTIPSDAFQVRAMIQILNRFGWTWVGLLISDDDYGLHAARSFQSDFVQTGGGCLAYVEVLPWGSNLDELRRIVDGMKKSTAHVVIVFAHQIHMIQLMKEVVRQNVTGLQWIASEAWTAAAVLQTSHLMPYLAGTLGIAIRRGEIPGLRDFLLRIRPDLNYSNKNGNSMVRQFWEFTFHCRFSPPPSGWLESGGVLCTGEENLENHETELLDVSELRPEYNVYKAVYALAHALDDMLKCEPGRGPFSGHSCATLQRLEPWQLGYYLQKANFTTSFGDQVSFDENGDALPIYDVMNWHWLPDGRTEVKTVAAIRSAMTTNAKIVIVIGTTLKQFHLNGLHKPGDVILGGLVEVHYTSVFPKLTFTSEPHQPTCKGFDTQGFRHAMAMVFAVHEINRNSNLLPNVTLGYSLYDNCGALIIGFRAALVLASSQEEQFLLQQNCSGNPPVLGIVGDSYSTFSIASSNVLGLFRFPMVSHFATCSCLSDRQRFPSFFRTIPSDAFQVRAMIQILNRFGWTWVGLLVSDDDYGLHVARSFQSDLVQSGGGCLSYSEVLPWGNDASELRRIVDVMKKSTARVVMVFAHEIHIYQLMKEVVRQNVTGLQWMASEAWTSVDVLQTSSFMPYLAGTLGIAIRKGEMFGFKDFLLRIHPEQVDNKYGNSIVRDFLILSNCRFAHQGWLGADGPLCTGQEDLKNVKSELFDVSNLRPEYNVYKAVYALAHALHDMLQCEPGRGPFTGHSCGSLKGLEPWQLVYYLDNINFTTPFGDQVTFDENGDALPIYDIMNWHWLPDGTTHIQNVGEVKESARGEELTLDEDRIFWNFESKQVTVYSQLYPKHFN
ncbi:uncharacterized protein V6R79_012714 [Siganus canaliculatus]